MSMFAGKTINSSTISPYDAGQTVSYFGHQQAEAEDELGGLPLT